MDREKLLYCDVQYHQHATLVQRLSTLTLIICAALSSLHCFSELDLSEAAKSGEGIQGDDGLYYSVTESQHNVPVLLELPREVQASL